MPTRLTLFSCFGSFSDIAHSSRPVMRLPLLLVGSFHSLKSLENDLRDGLLARLFFCCRQRAVVDFHFLATHRLFFACFLRFPLLPLVDEFIGQEEQQSFQASRFQMCGCPFLNLPHCFLLR